MLETIQQSAISHDRYQVELKLDYEVGKGKKTHYRISTYIFFPKSLGITEDSYPKNEFYRDVKNYIRIKTPTLSLRDLLDSDITPLSNVQQIVRLVRVVLDYLPRRYGEVLEWKYIEGHSVKEIAGFLGVAPKAAESTLTRARNAFKDGFAALGIGESLELNLGEG